MRDDNSSDDSRRQSDEGASAVGFVVGVAVTIAVLVFVPGARERLPGEVDLAGQGSSFAADDLPRLYQDVYDGVARFEVETCERALTGSGALVAADLVLTAAHVVQGSATIKVLAAGQSAVGTVVGISPDDDLALVKTDIPLSGHVFEVADATPSVGQAVVALGYPLSGPLSMTAPGVVSGLGVDVKYEEAGMSVGGLMQMDLATNSGNSGGPVLDPRGRLVGVVSGGAGTYLVGDPSTEDLDVVDVDGIKYATPAGSIAQRMDEWSAAPQQVPAADCNAEDGADGIPPSAGLVTTTVEDAEAPAVVDMFTNYADGINTGDYQRAYAQLSDRQRAALSPEEFEDRQKSSVLLDFVVVGLARDGDDLLARSAFTTNQDPEDGPDGSGLSCTFWSFDWVLAPGGDHGWQIDDSREIEGTARFSPCGT